MTEVADVGGLRATERALWDQVRYEAGVVVKCVQVRAESLPSDSRPVLADFYEEYGLEVGLGEVRGDGLARCLRWCVSHGVLVHLSWFNAERYSNGDANDLDPELFRLLKVDGDGGEVSNYYREYDCTKDAYLDLLQALESYGYPSTAKGVW